MFPLRRRRNLEHDEKINLQKRVANKYDDGNESSGLRSWGFNNVHILDGGIDVYIQSKMEYRCHRMSTSILQQILIRQFSRQLAVESVY